MNFDKEIDHYPTTSPLMYEESIGDNSFSSDIREIPDGSDNSRTYSDHDKIEEFPILSHGPESEDDTDDSSSEDETDSDSDETDSDSDGSEDELEVGSVTSIGNKDPDNGHAFEYGTVLESDSVHNNHMEFGAHDEDLGGESVASASVIAGLAGCSMISSNRKGWALFAFASIGVLSVVIYMLWKKIQELNKNINTIEKNQDMGLSDKDVESITTQVLEDFLTTETNKAIAKQQPPTESLPDGSYETTTDSVVPEVVKEVSLPVVEEVVPEVVKEVSLPVVEEVVPEVVKEVSLPVIEEVVPEVVKEVSLPVVEEVVPEVVKEVSLPVIEEVVTEMIEKVVDEQIIVSPTKMVDDLFVDKQVDVSQVLDTIVEENVTDIESYSAKDLVAELGATPVKKVPRKRGRAKKVVE